MGYDFTTQLLMSEMKKSNATMHAANSKLQVQRQRNPEQANQIKMQQTKRFPF